MAEPQEQAQGQQADLAGLLAVIERAAGDLGLAEEPAGFIAALEAEAGGEGPR